MTRDETKILIAAMEVAYPNYHPKDRTLTVNTWASMLEAYDYELVQLAFKKYVLTDTSGFAPSIGQIVALMQGITEGDGISEMQVWTMVYKAICNSSYHADEEYTKLPPVVQRAVGSAEQLKNWAAMDNDTVNSVIQSNVLRSYRAAKKAARDNAALPPGFRKKLEAYRRFPRERNILEDGHG